MSYPFVIQAHSSSLHHLEVDKYTVAIQVSSSASQASSFSYCNFLCVAGFEVLTVVLLKI
jgi:hypothetical protein